MLSNSHADEDEREQKWLYRVVHYLLDGNQQRVFEERV